MKQVKKFSNIKVNDNLYKITGTGEIEEIGVVQMIKDNIFIVSYLGDLKLMLKSDLISDIDWGSIYI